MNWISVKDRLPNKQDDCLVWYESKFTYPHIRTACYLGDSFFSTGGIQHSNFTITHWMPLPEPPKTK